VLGKQTDEQLTKPGRPGHQQAICVLLEIFWARQNFTSFARLALIAETLF